MSHGRKSRPSANGEWITPQSVQAPAARHQPAAARSFRSMSAVHEWAFGSERERLVALHESRRGG